MFNKRGLTPLIENILLIGLTIVLAILIFSLIQQSYNKYIKEADISTQRFQVIIDTSFLINFITVENNQLLIEVENRGNTDILGFIIRSEGTNRLQVDTDETELNRFYRRIIVINPVPDVGSIKSIEVIPKVLVNNRPTFLYESRQIDIPREERCRNGAIRTCSILARRPERICYGNQTCINNRWDIICDVGPEICDNGIDDNCNGMIDDNCP